MRKIFIFLIIFLPLFVITQNSSSNMVSALRIPPQAFFINFDQVIPYDDLSIETQHPSGFFKLKGIDDDRILNIYTSSIYEDTQEYHRYQNIPLKLDTSSTKIIICTYIGSTKKCGNQVEGEREGPITIEVNLSDNTIKANKHFLDAYQYELSPEELENILEANQLPEYIDYTSYILSKDKKIIEDFQILSVINGKRFTIMGSVYYEPNVSTFKEQANLQNVKKDFITISDIVNLVFQFVVATMFFLPILLWIIKRKTITGNQKTNYVIMMIISIGLFIIYQISKIIFAVNIY